MMRVLCTVALAALSGAPAWTAAAGDGSTPSPSPAPAPGSSAPLVTFPTPEGFQALDARMRALVDSGRRGGVVWAIAREGAPLHLRAYGQRDKSAGRPMTTDTIFRIYSQTRAVSTVALLRLVEQGQLSIDDPVDRYIPSFAKLRVIREVRDGRVVTAPARTGMTVRHLLTYTSGYGYAHYYPPAAGVRHLDILALDQSIQQGMDKLARYPLLSEPGARWDYGYHSDVVGRLIEIASGMRTDDYLQQAIFGPLGMVDTGFFVPEEKSDRLVHAYDAQGQDVTAKLLPLADWGARKPFQSNGGGLVTTGGDWIRFTRMLLNGGSLDGVRILQPESVAALGRNQITREQGPLFWGDKSAPDAPSRFDGYGWGYGVGVRLEQGPWSMPGTPGELFWGGLAGTNYLIDRHNRLVALAFTQYQGPDGDAQDGVMREALYGPILRPRQ